MNQPTFVEIVFSSNDFPFNERDEVEDPLEEALTQANVGEIVGGGHGLGFIHIDVDLTDLKKGLEVIRLTLLRLGLTSSQFKFNIEEIL
jgi:hypothetical protein